MTREKRKRVRVPKRETLGANTYELSNESKDVLQGIDDGWQGHSENRLMYDPQPQHRLPESGAWVMITRQLPPLERDMQDYVRVGRFFYAERSSEHTDVEGFGPDGYYKARLQTEWGDVWVWPYEYAKVETDAILSMWQKGELIFHPTDVSLVEFNAQVFYVRSRGIPLGEAAAMALGSIEVNIGWFEPREDLVDELEEFSKYATHEMGRLTETNYKRRAEARKRRQIVL